MRGELDRYAAARRLLEDARDVDHARSLAGADVEPTGVETASRRQWFRGGKPDCTRDVTDIDVVAGLQAIAEDRQWLVVEDAPAENGDDASFAVRVLTRPIDVSEAHRDSILAVHAAVV